MCIDVIRQHSEFDNPDELMEIVKPLAEKQSADTKKRIEENNKILAERWKEIQEEAEKVRNNSYSNNSDEYDVSGYYSAEDFYDDHYDDFFNYYDAKEYYEEHGGF